MTVSKIVAGAGTKMNHRERRALAKRLVGQSVCKKHQVFMRLQGTQLICHKCREDRRIEKYNEKNSKKKKRKE